jgi:hypothetical protein
VDRLTAPAIEMDLNAPLVKGELQARLDSASFHVMFAPLTVEPSPTFARDTIFAPLGRTNVR